MIENGYPSRGTALTIVSVRVLDAAALRTLMGDLIDDGSDVSGGHVVEVASDEGGSRFEIVTYPQCVEGHIVIHTGHEDHTTGMSVEDGSVVTTIPCVVAADAPAQETTAELAGTDFLSSVPPDLVDRVDLTDGVLVVVTTGAADLSAADRPISTTWSTAACENGHVVMHYGHEDPNTMTSVYDGSVVTTVPCSR